MYYFNTVFLSCVCGCIVWDDQYSSNCYVSHGEFSCSQLT